MVPSNSGRGRDRSSGRHRFGKSARTASGPRPTAARFRGMPTARAHESLVGASAQQALCPPAEHRQHQWDRCRATKEIGRSLTCIVASPTRQAYAVRPSAAGSLPHAPFEIRQSSTIGIDQRRTKVQPMCKTPDQQRSGGRGSSKSSSLARWPGLSGCGQRRDQRVPENWVWGEAARSLRVLDARARGLAGPRYASGFCGERSLASKCIGPGDPERQHQTAGRERPSLLPQPRSWSKFERSGACAVSSKGSDTSN